MAAANTDKFMEIGNPGTATTLSAPGYTAGGTSITVGSTSNWPTATGAAFAIDEAEVVDGKEVQIAGTYNEFVGTVSTGTSVTNVDWVRGVGDRSYSAGALTRVYVPVSAERENRLAQGIVVQHNQDGTHSAITATSVAASGAVSGSSVASTGDVQLRSTSIETIRSETMFDYVASGGVWSGDAYASTRNASMTALTCYINGRRGTISAVTARSFTASKDTYVDVLNSSGTFSLVYTEVANNAASPALAANSIRIAIIVTGAANIAAAGSVNQGQESMVLPIASSVPYAVTDSLGNLICPRDPLRTTLGTRVIASDQVFTSASDIQITALSVPVLVPTSRKVRITAHIANITDTNLRTGRLKIWDGAVGGTLLQSRETFMPNGGFDGMISCDLPTTLSPGLHTINASYAIGNGASTHTVRATSNIIVTLR